MGPSKLEAANSDFHVKSRHGSSIIQINCPHLPQLCIFHSKTSLLVCDCRHQGFLISPGEGEGVFPSNMLMGLMCCWMGSHFHGWVDYNGLAFSL